MLQKYKKVQSSKFKIQSFQYLCIEKIRKDEKSLRLHCPMDGRVGVADGCHLDGMATDVSANKHEGHQPTIRADYVRHGSDAQAF